MYVLAKGKTKKRLLILTDKKFYDRFKRDADGLISKDTEIVFVSVDYGKYISNIENKPGNTKNLLRSDIMRKRNWLVGDNLVALYLALDKYKDLDYGLKEITKIITHKGFRMRIQQFVAIHMCGRK